MSEVFLTRDEIEHPYANLAVMLEDKRRKAEQMSKTVFARITSSPEVLAEKLVYQLPDGWWVATIVYDGAKFTHRETAIAATVARLKEVEK